MKTVVYPDGNVCISFWWYGNAVRMYTCPCVYVSVLVIAFVCFDCICLVSTMPLLLMFTSSRSCHSQNRIRSWKKRVIHIHTSLPNVILSIRRHFTDYVTLIWMFTVYCGDFWLFNIISMILLKNKSFFRQKF